LGKSLVFDLNANPERAAFQIAKPGMLTHPEATIFDRCSPERSGPRRAVGRKDSSDHQMKLKGNHLFLVLLIAAQADTSSSQTP
jgi:hypothetical protein